MGRLASDPCDLAALRAGRLSDIMTVAGLLDHVSLLDRVGAWLAHLDLLIADVVIVLMFSLDFIILVAGARDSSAAALGRLVPHTDAIGVTIGQCTLRLQLDFLDRCLLVGGEVLAPRLVTSLIDLWNFLTNTVRLVHILNKSLMFRRPCC